MKMVRGYIRRIAPVQGEDIKNAIRYYRSNVNPSQRETCAAFGLTRSVFQKYLKINPCDIPNECSQGRHAVFTKDMEEEILSYIHMLANRFYAITRQSLAELAYNLAERNHLEHPFIDGRAGDGWVTSFLERHCHELSLRTGTPLSLIRITAFKKPPVYRFFDLLEEIVSAKNYDAGTIFNMDETGVSIVPSKPPKRIARRGVRSVPVMVPAERGQLCTIICSFSASGVFVPPMFLFPFNAKDISMDHAPTNAIFSKTAKGWSTSEAFLKWLKHFRKFAAATIDVPVLLILDNHSSHVSFQAVSYCRRHHIDLLTLPPHTTHKLQPCDVSFFGPLKNKYSQYLVRWLSERPGCKPRISDIPSIFKPAYEDACKPDTAINGFQKTGIWQFNTFSHVWGPNRHVYDEEFSDQSDEAENSSGNDDNEPPPSPPDSPLRSQRNEEQFGSNESVNLSGFNSVNSPNRSKDQGTSEYPFWQSCETALEQSNLINPSSEPPLDQPFGLLPDHPDGPPPDQPLGSDMDPPNGPPMDQPLELQDFPDKTGLNIIPGFGTDSQDGSFLDIQERISSVSFSTASYLLKSTKNTLTLLPGSGQRLSSTNKRMPALIPLNTKTRSTKDKPNSRPIQSFPKSVDHTTGFASSSLPLSKIFEDTEHDYLSHMNMWCMIEPPRYPQPSALSAMLDTLSTNLPAPEQYQTESLIPVPLNLNFDFEPCQKKATELQTNQLGGPPLDQPPGFQTDLPGGPPLDQPPGFQTDPPGGPPSDQPPRLDTDSLLYHSDQPSGFQTDLPGGPPFDQPPGFHTDPPGGLPCDQPSGYYTKHSGEPRASTSKQSQYTSSDSDVGVRVKKVKRRRINTRKSESQGYDFSSSDDEFCTHGLFGVSRRAESEILTGRDEALNNNEYIDLIVPRGSFKRTFTVGPQEVGSSFQFPEIPLVEPSKRKPRECQKAELMTSNENMSKLSQKQARKKAKTSEESSDERRKTRSISQAEKVILRSGKRVK